MARHKILIIGTGSIGERHTRCFGLTGRCDVGIVETRAELLRQVADRYSITAAFTSIDDALKQKWDAAVVATPANTHIPIARKLAQRRVNLLIEKPLSTSLDGVDDLIKDVASNEVVAGVAYVYRAHPVVQRLRQMIDTRRFGAARQLYLVSGQHFPTYRPAYREIYYARRESGGGAIQDALTHQLNLGEWLVGPIDRLAADAAHQQLEGVSVEDTVHLIARQGRVMATYSLNQYQSPNESVLTVVCESGTLRFTLQKGELSSMSTPGDQWQLEVTVKMERDDWFIAQGNAFLDALEKRVPVLCTIREAAQTLRATLAALECADSGSSLRPV